MDDEERKAASKAAHGTEFKVWSVPTYNLLPLGDRFQERGPEGMRYAGRINGQWVRVRFENEIKEEERAKQRKLEKKR